MSATFYCLADINFCTSHQPLLSGSDLPSVVGYNYRTPNDGFVRAGATVRVLPLRRFAPIRTSRTQSFLRYRRPSPNIALQWDVPQAARP
jgi:hypothetical protein